MPAKRGDIVLVQFWDHVEDGDEPMLCNVAGRLKYKGVVRQAAGKRRRFLVIESWWLQEEGDTNEENAKVFTILASTVERVSVLHEESTEEPPRRCKGRCGKPPASCQPSSEASRSESTES